MPSVAISSGHALKVRGAKGFIDEVDESRKVVDRVEALLRQANVSVFKFHDNSSTTVSANLNAIVNWHNARTRDRDLSVHFNAFSTTQAARGTEVLHRSQPTLAASLSLAQARAGGFINRGAKARTDLRFLNSVNRPALLTEICFVDSRADVDLYLKNFEAICIAVAETISGVKIPGVVTPPFIEPPAPPPAPSVISGDNIVDLTIAMTGDASVSVNGDPFEEARGSPANQLNITLQPAGDVVVNINGEDFQIAPPELPTHVPRPTLRRGDKGEAVRELQRALNAKGASLTIDGDFGQRTTNAVEVFQRQRNLKPDGIVGPLTWGALLA